MDMDALRSWFVTSLLPGGSSRNTVIAQKVWVNLNLEHELELFPIPAPAPYPLDWNRKRSGYRNQVQFKCKFKQELFSRG